MTTRYADAAADRVSLRGRDGTIACFDPATLEPLGEVPVTPGGEVADRIDRARRAGRRWRKSSFATRREVLGRVLDHVLAHADELCDAVVRDAGKTRENAMLGEIWPVCEKLRWTIRHGERHLLPERFSAGLFPHKVAEVEYQPRGVVGVITPWNYPLQNILGPTIPALMAGNAVVVKVSEWCSWSAPRFQQIFDEALEAEGFSPDVVQILAGYAETGEAVVRGGVDLVVFTGSVDNGKKVIAASADTITPLVLELGGKDAFIVCEDAHLEQAVHAALAGAFIAAGQNCLAAERMIIHQDIYDRFEQRLVEEVQALRQGASRAESPVDVGAMVSPAQVDIVAGLVDDARQRGARVLVGGHRVEGGQFYAPTVLADVTPAMAIAREETFGPVAVLMKATSDADAVHIANGTQFGLGATVLTKSRRRAKKIQRQLETGGVSVNDFGFTYMAQSLPFGGFKASGFGRLNGREGLRACTNPQAILRDRFPGLHAPAKLYPVGTQDYDMARGVIRMLYARGVRGTLRGLGELAKTALSR